MHVRVETARIVDILMPALGLLHLFLSSHLTIEGIRGFQGHRDVPYVSNIKRIGGTASWRIPSFKGYAVLGLVLKLCAFVKRGFQGIRVTQEHRLVVLILNLTLPGPREIATDVPSAQRTVHPIQELRTIVNGNQVITEFTFHA